MSPVEPQSVISQTGATMIYHVAPSVAPAPAHYQHQSPTDGCSSGTSSPPHNAIFYFPSSHSSPPINTSAAPTATYFQALPAGAAPAPPLQLATTGWTAPPPPHTAPPPAGFHQFHGMQGSQTLSHLQQPLYISVCQPLEHGSEGGPQFSLAITSSCSGGGSAGGGPGALGTVTLATPPGHGQPVFLPHPVNPLMNSTNMEVVWHGIFNKLFSQYAPHRWSLEPLIDQCEPKDCCTFNDSAKVRFLCKNCGNAWTSMKGRVIFWIRGNSANSAGTVYFKLFGQQCGKCNPGTFEHAMWYPEEVVKVVTNVFNRVGQLFYGFQQPVMSVVRRTGRPRTQHNSKLCQACAMNICREGFRASGGA